MYWMKANMKEFLEWSHTQSQKVNIETWAIRWVNPVTEFSSINRNTYLDIANLDKYDCILGTTFLRKHRISLDFEHQEIVICRRLRIPTLPEGEGEAEAKPPK